MKVVVSFAERFDGQVANAAWLIDSPTNRRWISDHWSQIDPSSATFRSDSDVGDILDNVLEHHPDWTEIVVQHAALTAGIEGSFGRSTNLSRTKDGFIINRL